MIKNEGEFINLKNKLKELTKKGVVKKKDSKKFKTSFTMDDAIKIAKELKIDFTKEKFTVEEFKEGLNVELEHGSKFKKTDVTGNDPIITGKIALAHLNEIPDYYERLKKLEEEAKIYWSKR